MAKKYKYHIHAWAESKGGGASLDRSHQEVESDLSKKEFEEKELEKVLGYSLGRQCTDHCEENCQCGYECAHVAQIDDFTHGRPGYL